MHAIRLAVCHSDKRERDAIAARVHGCAVEESPNTCNAVMHVGSPGSEVIEQHLAARKHALLVAEVCPTREVIEGHFASAREAGVQFCFANPDRYLPSRQLVRKQLSGPLGEPGLLRLHRWEPTPPQPTDIPEAILRDLDLTLWLMGRRPNRVYSLEQKHAGSTGHCVQVHLGFPNGGMALLDFNNRLPAGDGYQSLSVIAASGAAYADDHQNRQLAFRGGSPDAVRTEERSGQLAAIAQEFVDALRSSHNLMTTNAANWRDVFAVAGAVKRSLAVGQSVAIAQEDR
ncbi:MAG: hypothetical protein K8U57_05305 [Planctomycetes bacterium]|nr:hypothetical protein [Planctomycetota bacterium]